MKTPNNPDKTISNTFKWDSLKLPVLTPRYERYTQQDPLNVPLQQMSIYEMSMREKYFHWIKNTKYRNNYFWTYQKGQIYEKWTMDLVGSNSEMENWYPYVLTVICMLTNYVFMIPINTKTTEDVINAHLKKHVYATFCGSKYMLSDRGGEFSSKQFTWLGKEVGFMKVYTSLYTPVGNSLIERIHSFLKTSLWKLLVIIIQIGRA